jgi:hypothetical protein
VLSLAHAAEEDCTAALEYAACSGSLRGKVGAAVLLLFLLASSAGTSQLRVPCTCGAGLPGISVLTLAERHLCRKLLVC